MLDAIQQGILTTSTKERLEILEKQKSELSVQIIKEELANPTLSREQIIFWFHRFRKLNTKRIDHRRRMIDSFVNAIFLYDDRIMFTFNYKDGTKTINFTELEKSGLGSDINALAAPEEDRICPPGQMRSPFFTLSLYTAACLRCGPERRRVHPGSGGLFPKIKAPREPWVWPCGSGKAGVRQRSDACSFLIYSPFIARRVIPPARQTCPAPARAAGTGSRPGRRRWPAPASSYPQRKEAGS